MTKPYPDQTLHSYLWDKQALGFNIPEVYYYADLGRRYLIILGRLPGLSLERDVV